jgi:hypothetical protein
MKTPCFKTLEEGFSSPYQKHTFNGAVTNTEGCGDAWWIEEPDIVPEIASKLPPKCR